MDEKIHLQTLYEADSVAQALRDWSGFVTFQAGEMAAAPDLRLVPSENVDSQKFLEEHGFVGRVAPIGCHFLDNITYSGFLYPFKGNVLIDDGSHLSMVSALWLQHHSAHRPGARSGTRVRVIDEPVLAVAGPGHQTYGHWIIDFLPRLAIARSVLGDAFRTLKFLLLSDTPSWAVTLMASFCGVAEQDIIRFHADGDEFLCRRVCYPTYAHTYPFLLHSFNQTFFRVFDHPAQRHRKICAVRRLPGADSRDFTSRAAFEEMAQNEGYELVDPQLLTIWDQVKLFGGAAVVIGEYGSALHNSVFSADGTVVGVLNAPGVEQTRLCAAFHQPIVYLPSSEKNGPWSLTKAELERFFQTVRETALENPQNRDLFSSGTPAPRKLLTVAPSKFDNIDAYQAGAGNADIAFVALAPGVTMLPDAPVFIVGPVPEAATAEMFSSHNVGPAGYYRIKDAFVAQDGIVIHNETVMSSVATNHPQYHCELILKNLDQKIWKRPPRKIPGQGVVLFGPGWPVWGHWLVDFLPRFYLISLSGYEFSTLRWIVPKQMPDFARNLLSVIGIPETALIEFDSENEVLHLDEVLLPTKLAAGALMHPSFADALRWTRSRMIGGSSKTSSEPLPIKIFLSRKRGNSHHRELINRDQLEDIAVSFGYAIYHPTEMTVSEQIALFEGASHIAGEYGSALHTSMFSAPGTVITCLRGTSHTAGVLQNGLAKSCGQKVGYIFGESLPENPRQAYKIAEKTFILGMECAELARKIGTFEVFSR